MELIDKDTLVAEIDRLQDSIKATAIDNRISKEQAEAYRLCVKLRSFIEDTLEEKDVKKETMSDDLEEAIGQSFIYHESHGDDFRSDKQIETAYICGFKSGAKWADKHLMKVKEVDMNKEIKDYFDNQPIITRSKGVDYQLIPSGKDIAKHFFELGLKAKKGE